MSTPIAPGSVEWSRRISPSKVSAILGISRYESQYTCWHRLKGNIGGQDHKPEFDTGHDEEWSMAATYRREHPGWQLSPAGVQIVHDESKYGYPVVCTLDRRARRGPLRRVVEFKSARGEEAWGAEFNDEPPIYYVAQVMAQMLFTGYTREPAHLMAKNLIGCSTYTYTIPYDRSLAAAIHQRCGEFWLSLQGDEPPDLDDSVSTYECVRALHPRIDGTTAEVPPELARHLLDWDHDLQGAERAVRKFKTELLDLMGDAQYAVVDGIQIADRRPHGRGGVALNLTRKNYDAVMAAYPYSFTKYTGATA